MPSAAAAAPRRRLIWNADDFGYSTSINAGIARAHESGLVRGASVLAGGVAFEDAARLARGMPGLEIGVHLAAVGVPPVLPASQLPGWAAADGRLPARYVRFLAGYALGRIAPSLVEAEWEAQIARVRDAGLRPTYVDSHQHLHVLPGLLEVTVRLMRRHAIRRVRTPGDVVEDPTGPLRMMMLSGLFLLGHSARAQVRRSGLITADGTLGIAAAGRLDAARVRSWIPRLRALPRGTWEVVSHPGLGEPPGSAAAGWGYRWAEELAAACDGGVKEALAEAGIEVCSWRTVAGEGTGR